MGHGWDTGGKGVGGGAGGTDKTPAEQDEVSASGDWQRRARVGDFGGRTCQHSHTNMHTHTHILSFAHARTHPCNRIVMQELGYYQQKKLEEYKRQKAEKLKRESRTVDKLMRQVERGTQLTEEAQAWMDKKIKEDPSLAQRMDVREQGAPACRSVALSSCHAHRPSPPAAPVPCPIVPGSCAIHYPGVAGGQPGDETRARHK